MQSANPWVKDDLTPKQQEYVAALASGLSTVDISRFYHVSHHTVRNTIAKAKERVGAISTNNLIAVAVDKGWVKKNGQDVPAIFTADGNE